MRNHRTAMNLRNIDANLRDMFKSWCAKRGITMTDQIERMMRACLNEDRKWERIRRREEEE